MISKSRRIVRLYMVVIFALSPVTMALGNPQPAVRLDLTQQGLYPFQGDLTPIFHTTVDGQIVLIPGQNSLGKTSHALASSDQGRSWHHWDAFGTWPTMAYADVIRRGKELLAFGHNGAGTYGGTYLWRSSDEGLTWTGGNRLTQDTDAYAPMNQRVLQTASGRLIVPVEQIVSGSEGSGANQIGTVYSDNGGQSWARSEIFGPPAPLPDRPEGFGEPAVVELDNGVDWMVYRTRFGDLWQAWSGDGGATWGQSSATTLVSPLSSVNAKRIPGTDAVITIWNNATPGTSENWSDANNLWRPRSPLVYAISTDNCQTWSEPVTIDTGTAAYPSIYFSDTEMFVAYWEDPDPAAVYLNPNSHLNLVAYNLQSLVETPEPSSIVLLATALLGLLGYGRRLEIRRLIAGFGLCVVVVATLCFGCVTCAFAADGPQPSFRLNLSKTYPMDVWKGEVSPIFHRTAQDQLVLIQGNGSIGKPPHAMISDDQGRTWHNWDAFKAWPKMAYADVVRHGNELLAFGFNNKDCYEGTYVWWSADEGKTWAGGKRLTGDKDRWAPMNNRVLVTSRGRLILPIEQLLGAEGPDPNKIGTIYSDDAGRSWTRSPIFGPPPPLPTKPEGFGEPSVVELTGGRIWMVFRTRHGHLWQAWSNDGGAHWGKPSSTGLVSPASAVNAKRIPGTNAVIAFWNHAKPGTSPNWNDYPNLWTPRSPLVFAISRDDCKTWSRPMTVETGTAAYPSICFSEKEMFAAHWMDPNPKAVYLNPKSDFTLVVYGIPSLLTVR